MVISQSSNIEEKKSYYDKILAYFILCHALVRLRKIELETTYEGGLKSS